MSGDHDVIIIGAGIGGLSFALALHKLDVSCRIFESVAELKPLGVGLNLLPHAMRDLSDLGIADKIVQKGVQTSEYCFFTHHGQFVYREPRGRFAGYEWPQVSIHRADLHAVLLEAVRERLGVDAVKLDHRCTGVEQDGEVAIAHFSDANGNPLQSVRSSVAIACDGVHSVVRRQFHPNEPEPRFQGTTQYRGVTRWKPYLSGASMVYLGTNETGKLVMYPVRNNIDAQGRQLINWVIEIVKPMDSIRDWNRASHVENFIHQVEDWRFDWMDIAGMLRAADVVYEYPMMDQDPLDFWATGRITLLGDAAHPMMPRGSNGAAQAIIDGGVLAGLLATEGNTAAALKKYESIRLKATTDVVVANRSINPDAVLRVVEERTGGKRFERIEDVMTQEELHEWQERYRRVAGFDAAALGNRAAGA